MQGGGRCNHRHEHDDHIWPSSRRNHHQAQRCIQRLCSPEEGRTANSHHETRYHTRRLHMACRPRVEVPGEKNAWCSHHASAPGEAASTNHMPLVSTCEAQRKQSLVCLMWPRVIAADAVLEDAACKCLSGPQSKWQQATAVMCAWCRQLVGQPLRLLCPLSSQLHPRTTAAVPESARQAVGADAWAAVHLAVAPDLVLLSGALEEETRAMGF